MTPRQPQPPHDSGGRGLLARTLYGLGRGFSIALGICIVLATVLYIDHFYATPVGLYHRTLDSTERYIYDPADLKNWSQWRHKYDQDIKTDTDAITRANEVLRSIGDPYTSLMDPDQVKASAEEAEGKMTGIGIVFELELDDQGKPVLDANKQPRVSRDRDGYPLIQRVMSGSPAQKAGMLAGDAIKSVNAKPTAGLTLEEVINAIRDKAGTKVVLEISRDRKTLPPLTIVRAVVAVPSVDTKMLPGNLGYIRLTEFGQLDGVEEMTEAMELLKGARAIILDLRGNPGGFVHISIGVSSLFVKEGKLVTIRSRIPGDPKSPKYEEVVISVTQDELVEETRSDLDPQRVKRTSGERTPYMLAGRPLVVLVDGNSASASEMTTGSVKDNGVAIVVGEKTFGKGIGQSEYTMPNGTLLHITTLRYFTPNGTWLGNGKGPDSHHGGQPSGGIEPDHMVKPLHKRFEPGSARDNQLKAAIELLEKKLSTK